MNQPPNPAQITRTETRKHRGRIHMHLFTDATATAPALVTSPATLAGIMPPFIVWWTDRVMARARRVSP